MKVDKTQLTFLNQLASEIVVLDKDLRIVWLNDSALNKGWVLNSNNKDNLITKLHIVCSRNSHFIFILVCFVIK